MAVYIRAKRVTDPLDEEARARLRGTIPGYASSGSEHNGAGADAAADNSCFSDLIHAFFEPGDVAEELDRGGSGEDSDSDDGQAVERAEKLEKKLSKILHCSAEADPFRLRLRSDVFAALRLDGPGLRRAVMARLREKGYNAGICKARWESAGGLTAGSYEYIDVVADVGATGDVGQRYIVDLKFSAEFEVARATKEYDRVVGALPAVAVARPEEVQAVVKIVAEAAQRSLKKRGLSVPPWRKKRYMMAKWLGPYRRTVNALPVAVVSRWGCDSTAMPRTTGFGVPVITGLPVPAAAE